MPAENKTLASKHASSLPVRLESYRTRSSSKCLPVAKPRRPAPDVQCVSSPWLPLVTCNVTAPYGAAGTVRATWMRR